MADTLTRRTADMPSKDSLRKSKKPLMEKRRRARINTCLNQLKTLVLQALNKDGSHFSKLEKADILEMTVKYLRGVQRSQMHSVMSGANTGNVRAKYRAGFNECANEVVRYVNTVHGVNDELRSRLMGHLSNCVQVVNTPTEASTASRVPLQPLYVQVPNAGVPTTHDITKHPVTARQGVVLWTPPSHGLHVNTAAPTGLSSGMPSPVFVSPYSQSSTSSRSSSPSSSVCSPASSGISSPSFPEPSAATHIVLQRNPSPDSSKSHGQFQQQPSSVAKCKEENVWRPW